MGHSSARAALIYQHATRERDEAIAAGMGKMLTQARRQAQSSGDRARNGHGVAVRHPESDEEGVDQPLTCGGAGEGNRTLMTSLEDR